MEGLKMAAQPLSPYKILELHTKDLGITIKSKTPPLFENDTETAKISSVDITAASLKHIKLDSCGIDKKYTVTFPSHVQFDTVPLFYENTDYEIVIQSNDGKRVCIFHENPDICKRIAPVTDGDEHIISGIVNFGNSIGLSEFKIIHNGNEAVILDIEIFPTKIGYKDDFRMMLTDISDEIYSSAIDYLKREYKWLQSYSTSGTPSENFMSIVSEVFDGYIKTAPYAVKSVEYTALNKPRVFASGSERILAQYMEYTHCIAYDTPKTRFIKFLLSSTARLLHDFDKSCFEYDKFSEMISEINDFDSKTFSGDFQNFTAANVMPSVAKTDLAFHIFYEYSMILKSALTINGDVFKMSVPDTAQLYGYWCFIRLTRIIKDLDCRLISNDLINTSQNGTTVKFPKNNECNIIFTNPRADEIITLKYIPAIDKLSFITLTVENQNNSQRQYIFAPRYRVATTPNGNIEPHYEDIDVMHRYRNTSLGTGKNDSDIQTRGAYVLFPYSDEEIYSEHPFYKSIETANVGGLPFLPDASQLTETLLQSIITESEPKRIILPQGYESVLSNLDFNECDVLVGSFGSVEQFNDNLENRYYYIPERNFELERLPIHAVALYQSEKLFGKDAAVRYWGDITGCRRVKRKSIKFPMRRNNPDEWYYVFSIREWKTLPSPIKTKGEGVFKPKYTNMFLLHNTDYSYELFDIRSGENFRLIYELKYILNSALKNKDTNKTLAFRLNSGEAVYIHDGYFDIQRENGEKLFEPPLRVSEISRRSKYYFNLIINRLKQS